MKDYEVYLLLEALCNTCSRKELRKSRRVSSVLARYLRIPRWEARLIVAGALEMKICRGERQGKDSQFLHPVH